MNTKLIKPALFASAIVVGLLASLPAAARHGHHGHGPRLSLGFAFGPPAYYGYGPRYYAPYYPPYSYYPAYPPAAAVPYPAPGPTVYVERDSAQTAPERPAGYWYYCAESQTYYPYVSQCPGGWQQVAPQPAP